MASLSERQDKIFDIIVTSYVETAEPVGSRTISRVPGVGLSPASVRNVMADLEEQGLIKQPHTSAGRVPTDRGYRYWVDTLMKEEELKEEEKRWVRGELSKARTVGALAQKVSKVISELTDNAALIYIRKLRKVSFLSPLLGAMLETQRLQDFLEEASELFIEGAFRVFQQPEFQDVVKMRLLLQAFDEKEDFLQVLDQALEEEGVQIHIGSENTLGELDNVSLVVKDCYFANTPIGGVAALGPTRMKYPKVVAVVDFVADNVTEAMNKF